MFNFQFVYIAMQLFLEKDGHYKGPIDGKVGDDTYQAIIDLLKSYGIDPTGWSKTRLRVAGEQALYRSLKIDVGAIDGADDHVMGYARTIFDAKLTMLFRDFAEKLWEKGVTKTIPVAPTPEAKKGKIVPFQSWPRQADCTKFFGKVGTNQSTCVMPYPLVIAWDKRKTVKEFSCHKLVKPALERIFQRTLDHYGYEKIKDLNLHLWGGCLNVRKVRGGSSYSMHSWGIAVDLDPDNNQLKWNSKQATFAKPAYNRFWEFVYDEGAISLGKERDYDWMHLQFARL